MNPEKINRYEIVELLGEGSIGKVYKAFDPFIKRNVAIKLLKADFLFGDDYEEFSKRFYKEAQIAGTLNHPNIAVVYDAGECEHVPFICMEFVRGIPLHQWGMQTEKPILIRKFVSIVNQIAEALDYAHAQGVIHRDIKPANILISEDLQVKILDFGIALFANIRTTKEGKVLGTPYYMAPEQILGQKIDHRVDIFALGVIAYEAITGTIPFHADTITGIITRIAYEEPDKPKDLESLGFVPAAWENVFSKVLSKDPNNRYRTASSFAKDFEAIFPVMQYTVVEVSPDIPLELDKTAVMEKESFGKEIIMGEKDEDFDPTLHAEEDIKPTVIYSPAQKMDLTVDEEKTAQDQFIELEEKDTIIVEEAPLESAEVKTPEIEATPIPKKSKVIFIIIPLILVLLGLAAAAFYFYKYKPAKSTGELVFTKDISDNKKPLSLIDKTIQFSNKSTISISSVPDGVEVWEDEIQIGTTPFLLQNFPPKTHSITLKMKGFEEVIYEIPSAQTTYSLSIALPLKPPEITTAEVAIISDPPDSSVFWRGKLVGKTPTSLTKLKPGDYVISIEKEGYKKWESKTTIKLGSKNQVIATLEKLEIKLPPPKPKVEKLPEPEIITKPIPVRKEYPGLPSRARVGGDVKLILFVSEKGEVEKIVPTSSPDPILTEAAIKAAQKWTFKPSMNQNGKKVKGKYDLIFRFQVK